MTPPTGESRKALGRGLSALIPSGPQGQTAKQPGGLRQLPVERIRPNRSQPRKVFAESALEELAGSIKLRGVLQPILVRRCEEGYEIVAGERRWRAATRAGLQEIPAIIKEFSETGVLEVALIENIQREDLDPLEEAEAYSRLINEHGLTQEQVAKAVGKGRATVANSLRLLQLPQAIVDHLAKGSLTAGHARAIMTLDSEADMLKLADDAILRSLSVRETEQKARMLKKSAKKGPTAAKTPAEINVEERLMRTLGTKVHLRQRNGKGRIEIFFHSLDELDNLLGKISP